MNEPTVLPPVVVNGTTEVKIAGVVMPTWFAALQGLAMVLSLVTFLLAIFFFRDAAAAYASGAKEVSHELRILQVHTMDIEGVLIRSRLATATDFAQWESGSPRHAEKEK